jgi:hypothetical protein
MSRRHEKMIGADCLIVTFFSASFSSSLVQVSFRMHVPRKEMTDINH